MGGKQQKTGEQQTKGGGECGRSAIELYLKNAVTEEEEPEDYVCRFIGAERI